MVSIRPLSVARQQGNIYTDTQRVVEASRDGGRVVMSYSQLTTGNVDNKRQKRTQTSPQLPHEVTQDIIKPRIYEWIENRGNVTKEGAYGGYSRGGSKDSYEYVSYAVDKDTVLNAILPMHKLFRILYYHRSASDEPHDPLELLTNVKAFGVSLCERDEIRNCKGESLKYGWILELIVKYLSAAIDSFKSQDFLIERVREVFYPVIKDCAWVVYKKKKWVPGIVVRFLNVVKTIYKIEYVNVAEDDSILKYLYEGSTLRGNILTIVKQDDDDDY